MRHIISYIRRSNRILTVRICHVEEKVTLSNMWDLISIRMNFTRPIEIDLILFLSMYLVAFRACSHGTLVMFACAILLTVKYRIFPRYRPKPQQNAANPVWTKSAQCQQGLGIRIVYIPVTKVSPGGYKHRRWHNEGMGAVKLNISN